MNDEIIQELWRIKDEIAREANYDVHALCRQLQEQQSAACGPMIDRSRDDEAICQTENDVHMQLSHG